MGVGFALEPVDHPMPRHGQPADGGFGAFQHLQKLLVAQPAHVQAGQCVDRDVEGIQHPGVVSKVLVIGDRTQTHTRTLVRTTDKFRATIHRRNQSDAG